MESMISTNHMMSKGLDYYSSSDHDDEESSWSCYLEEFKSSYWPPCNNETETGSKTSSLASLTLVSTDHPPQCQEIRIGAKRRKTDFTIIDHDLEDTASSPDYTPKMNKISTFQKPNLFQDLHKQQHDGSNGDASQAGGNDFRVEKRISDDDTADQLRRKGLCLVPVSMFLHYYYVS